MAAIDRTAYPRLSRRLSIDELDAQYGTTSEETTLTRKEAIGDSPRLTFLVMLKTRQQLGYFPLLGEVPEKTVNFLVDALGLPTGTALLDARVKTKTLFRYRALIRSHVQARVYSDAGECLIDPVVRSAALTISDPADLINLAIETSTQAKLELPAFSALDRLVGHLRHQVHNTLYRAITAKLDHEQVACLDALLEVPPGESTSCIAGLKETPGPATLNHIRLWSERLARLDAIIDPKTFLAEIAHTKIRRFAAEAARLQLSDLRDLVQPGKRHTLILCLLFQAQATTRDELVEMFLRRMRQTRHAAQDQLRILQEQHQAIEESLIGVLDQVLHQAKCSGLQS